MICSRCKKRPPAFNRKQCNICLQYDRERIADRKKLRRQRLQDWMRELKTSRPCERCGKISLDPDLVHWDHLPGYEKREAIANLIHEGKAKSTIEEEMAKCQLLCKRCHERVTGERMKGHAAYQPGQKGKPLERWIMDDELSNPSE